MPQLTVTKSYQDESVLTESMLDDIKDSLETFFNVTKIDSSNIQDAGVSTTNLVDLAVTEGKIAAAAVTTSKIVDAGVTTAKIADVNVTTGKLADAAVTTGKIADANVTTGKIADAAVTTAKLAAKSIQSSGVSCGSSSFTSTSANSIPNVGFITSWSGTRPVTLKFTGKGGADAFLSWSESVPTSYFQNGVIELLEDGVLIKKWFFGATLATGTAAQIIQTPTFEHVYVPVAGSHTYTMSAYISVGGAASASFGIQEYVLLGIEL